MFKDALKGALSGAQDLEAVEQPEQAKVASLVERLSAGPWLRALREHGPVAESAKLTTLIDISHKLQKTLKASGRGREAKALGRAHLDAISKLNKTAWSKVKARFGELGLPEKSYRRLKQSGADPHRLLARITTRRSEELQGAGDKRLREWLG